LGRGRFLPSFVVMCERKLRGEDQIPGCGHRPAMAFGQVASDGTDS
jgi:hypothetical protein